MRNLMLLLALVGCKGQDEDTDPLASLTDRDGDGFDATGDGGNDCDDTNPNIYPGAVEACGDPNLDCTPGNEPEPSDWYADADGDGFGDPEERIRDCEQPERTVADATDCDDTEDEVSPAEDEDCDDDIDNNCDGSSCLSGDVPAAVAWARITGRVNGDGAGASIGAAGDVDGDGLGDIFVGAPAASTGGELYVVTEVSGSISLDDAEFLFHGESDSRFGAAAILADRNGDLDLDLVVAAPGLWFGEDPKVWLFDGPLDDDQVTGNARARVTFEDDPDAEGMDALALGDMDGDGLDELAVQIDKTPGRAGRVAVYAGGDLVGGLDAEADGLVLTRDDPDDLMGAALAMGDLDGDGLADLVVGVPGVGTLGILQIYFGDADDTLVAGPVLEGTDGPIGTSIAIADPDGDGEMELIVGAGGGVARVYILDRPTFGDEWSLDDARTALLTGTGVPTVGTPGDLDLDGADELLIGTPDEVWLVRRPSAGDWLVDEQADARLLVPGDAPTVLAGAGDVNGDGYPDVLLGAPDDASGAGVAYVFAGP